MCTMAHFQATACVFPAGRQNSQEKNNPDVSEPLKGMLLKGVSKNQR